jgi:hypothetical protein
MCLRLLLACLTAFISSAAADTEYIVVSGGPAVRDFEDLRKPAEQHDRWWGNFIRTARVRMQEIHKTAPAGTHITWLVYRDGYVTSNLCLRLTPSSSWCGSTPQMSSYVISTAA